MHIKYHLLPFLIAHALRAVIVAEDNQGTKPADFFFDASYEGM